MLNLFDKKTKTNRSDISKLDYVSTEKDSVAFGEMPDNTSQECHYPPATKE